MRKFLLVVMTYLLASMACHAQALNEQQIKQKINRAASGLKSMQCDFVQTKQLKMLNDKIISKGKMYYLQPNRLRWEYISPYTYTFILNDAKVLVKNNGRNDVINVQQNKMFKEIVRIMMNSVLGKCLSDEKDFHVRISTTSSEWIAHLAPLRKDMKQMFQEIILHFSIQRSIVSKVELIERNGDKTLIELKNIRTNAPISPDIFAIR